MEVDELAVVQKLIESKLKEIEKLVFDPNRPVVRSADNMFDVLESDKRRNNESKLYEEFDLLLIRRGELLAIKNGNEKPPFSCDDYFKMKADIKSKISIDNSNPFVSFLSEEERANSEHENFYERGIYYGIKKLAEYGWYINYHFVPVTIVRAAGLINETSTVEIDRFMINEINPKLSLIESKLIARHPTRQLVLEAGFRAHRMGEYYLSIPVFLAQADGICYDHTTFKFFLDKKRKKYIPQVAEWAETKVLLAFHKALASALKDKGAFQLHYSSPNKIGITRHSILHGESVDYGNEINSLKAISLIAYLSDLFSN